MSKSEQLKEELERVLSGEAWYGPPVYALLERVSFEAAYEKPPGSIHTIAGIVLHMLAWTEETLDRLNGMAAGVPSSGDWPDPGKPDEQKWQNYVNDLKLVNVNLLGAIEGFPEDKWGELINDTRETEPVITYENLVTGLIRHHVYHAGQIALLTRITQMGG
jgi:uncharacterized damage-inducible protein DinB